jgi:pimeloyl-ACP methyl ester carboxylesterase
VLPRFAQGGRADALWRAFGVTAAGERIPLPVNAVARRPDPTTVSITLESSVTGPGVGALAAALRDLDDRMRPEDGLSELDRPLPGRDPISMWAPAVTAERDRERGPFHMGLLELPERNLGLTCWRATGGPPIAAAWHEDHFAVLEFPSGLSHVEVQYLENTSAKANRQEARRVINRERSLWRRLRTQTVTEVDWFCYAGENTMRAHGSGPVREGVLARAKSVQIETGGRPGTMHLKPWQWVGDRLTKPGEDPKWLDRLGVYTQALDTQALDTMGLVEQHPELAAVGDYTVTDPIVWVQGTVSCGLAHLRQLLRVVPYGRTVYRFEHDTFRDIDENIDQLVDQLRRKVSADTSRVILIGHSRGGLVVRGAARELAPDHPEVDFEVVTLGTPHTGTPLVNAGARVLRGLVAMTYLRDRRLTHPRPSVDAPEIPSSLCQAARRDRGHGHQVWVATRLQQRRGPQLRHGQHRRRLRTRTAPRKCRCKGSRPPSPSV